MNCIPTDKSNHVSYSALCTPLSPLVTTRKVSGHLLCCYPVVFILLSSAFSQVSRQLFNLYVKVSSGNFVLFGCNGLRKEGVVGGGGGGVACELTVYSFDDYPKCLSAVYKHVRHCKLSELYHL